MSYTPTDDEVVATMSTTCWHYEGGWDYMRSWFHGASLAMIACGRKNAAIDFEFLRDHCAFRDAEQKQKGHKDD